MKNLIFFLSIISWIVWAGCGELEPEYDSIGSAQKFTPDNVQNIFNNNCALSGCHAGSAPEHGQNLDSTHAYSNVVGITSVEMSGLKRIAPGDTANSYLFRKIKGVSIAAGTVRMPFGGPYLLNAQIDIIRQWILSGAPERMN